MPQIELPRYPRGFILADSAIEPPPTFVAGPLLPNFYIHPWTTVETASEGDFFVVVIGHCVSISSGRGQLPARNLLSALRSGDDQFFEVLNNYSGRHAIIFGTPEDIRVLNDATGMRAVFYACDGGMVSSHAQLIEKALGGPILR